jgi:hypothetical protein
VEDPGFANRFARWLIEDCALAEPRRVVRRDVERIVVSKFDEGFAARLHEAVGRLPELTDQAAVQHAYDAAAAATPASTRVAAWRSAVTALVETLAPGRHLDRDQLAEIRAGTDSVAALLDSILWSSPPVNDDYVASESERTAYVEALSRMDAQSGLFTRYYGAFEGARVENYCPGAQLARTLFAQAWTLCTTTPAR